MPDTHSIIRQYISRHFLSDERQVSDDEELFGTGIIDSLGLMETVDFLEKEFSISLPDRDIVGNNFESVNAIAKTVEKFRDSGANLR